LALQSYRLRRENRLGERKRIKEILETGTRYNSNLFSFSFSLKESSPVRLTVISPKRLGIAVFRNKLRRRIREVFRLSLPDYIGFFDIIIFPRKEVFNCNFKELTSEYKQCLHSFNLL